jgi:hypothetical protein
VQLHVGAKIVAVLGGKSSEYRRVVPRISMAPKFLRMNNLDGSVQFIRCLRLLDPVTLWEFFNRPPYEVGSNRLGDSATRATCLLDVEIAEC